MAAGIGCRVYFIEIKNCDFDRIKIAEKELHYALKIFDLVPEEVNNIIRFVNKNNAFKYAITFNFKDDFNKEGKSKEETQAYYGPFNEQNYEKYGLNRIKGYVIKSKILPQIDISELEELDFRLFLEILSTDDNISAHFITDYYRVVYK